MISAQWPNPAPAPLQLSCPAWLREAGWGYLYWLCFLLVLEPDNVLRALHAGHPLGIEAETLRIAVAAALGASITPLVFWFVRRFPVAGSRRWRHACLQGLGALGLAFGLVLVSCVLASWFWSGEVLPSLTYVARQMIGNWLLLTFALAAFGVLAHLGRSKAHDVKAAHLSQLTITDRGRLIRLDISQIDWIETQGNYLALHTAGKHHLIRQTLTAFGAGLDANSFVRIHRQTIVNISRIWQIESLENGDGLVHLDTGQALRISRRYRKALRQKWQDGKALASTQTGC